MPLLPLLNGEPIQLKIGTAQYTQKPEISTDTTKIYESHETSVAVDSGLLKEVTITWDEVPGMEEFVFSLFDAGFKIETDEDSGEMRLDLSSIEVLMHAIHFFREKPHQKETEYQYRKITTSYSPQILRFVYECFLAKQFSDIGYDLFGEDSSFPRVKFAGIRVEQIQNNVLYAPSILQENITASNRVSKNEKLKPEVTDTPPEKRNKIMKMIHGYKSAMFQYELINKKIKANAIDYGFDSEEDYFMIHRDFKPSNLLKQGDSVYVVDFGISYFYGGLTFANTILGAELYMHPNQFLDNDKIGRKGISNQYDRYSIALSLMADITSVMTGLDTSSHDFKKEFGKFINRFGLIYSANSTKFDVISGLRRVFNNNVDDYSEFNEEGFTKILMKQFDLFPYDFKVSGINQLLTNVFKQEYHSKVGSDSYPITAMILEIEKAFEKLFAEAKEREGQ